MKRPEQGTARSGPFCPPALHGEPGAGGAVFAACLPSPPSRPLRLDCVRSSIPVAGSGHQGGVAVGPEDEAGVAGQAPRETPGEPQHAPRRPHRPAQLSIRPLVSDGPSAGEGTEAAPPSPLTIPGGK